MDIVLDKKTVKANKIKSDKSITGKVFTIISCVILVAFTISLIFSMVWGFISSFKMPAIYLIDDLTEQFKYPFAERFGVKNYVEVVTYFDIKVRADRVVNIGQQIWYSVLYSVGGAICQTAACCFMAYIVARFNFLASKIIYATVLVVMVLPIVGALPSQVQILTAIGLYNSMAGLYALAFTFYGMHFLIMHAAFKTIPKDFSEAAMIDGAGQWRIMLTIMLPLVKSTFFTIFLLKFIAFWNDYQTPLLFAQDYPILSYGLHNIQNGSGNHGAVSLNTDPHKLAAAMLIFLPILILFVTMHNRLMGNVMAGGVKG